MNIIYTSDHSNNYGDIVLYNVNDGYIIQDNIVNSIKLNKCNNLIFPRLNIYGNAVNRKSFYFKPSIKIMRSNNLTFNSISITGNPLLNTVTGKKQWNKLVQSGIDNGGDDIIFKNVHIVNTHDGIINNGNRCMFNGVSVENFSGDAFFNSGNKNSFVDISTETPLKTLDYRFKHRDIFQIATINDNKEIHDINIFGLIHSEGNTRHPLYQPTDGGLIHTDGKLINLNANDIIIISDIEYHGISSVCLISSKISILRLITKYPENDIVHLDDRKRIGKSYNNTITIDR